jgi:hypothetical protein
MYSDALRGLARGYGPLSFDYIAAAGAPEDLCKGGTNIIHAARVAARQAGWFCEVAL